MTALLLLLLCLGCQGRPRSAPQALFSLPDFAMSSVKPSSTAPFGRKDLLGRVWIADFIFTRCAGPCPLLSERLSALGKELPGQIGLLTISVDPAADTAERLRAYARRHGADLARWVFLRGSIQDTDRLVSAGFRLPLSGRQPPVHSTKFVLIDQRGVIRGYYDGLDQASGAALARDARLLLKDGV